MAKGQVKSNKEAKKPKKEVKKTIAANPSTKGTLLKEWARGRRDDPAQRAAGRARGGGPL
jgi:hypothetical protein